MRFLHYLAVLLLAIFMTACGGGGGSPGKTANSKALFTTAPGELNLALGSAQSYAIGGGTPPYSIASSNSAVVVTSLSGSDFTLGAAGAGSASVVVRDADGASTSISTSVQPGRALFTTAPSSVTIGVGVSSAQVYQVGGGTGPYIVTSSNPSVVSAVLSAGNLTITGLAAGSGTVQVLDTVGATVSIAVTVTSVPTVDLFTTASGVTLPIGATATYTVGGGTPPYSVTSTNTSIATGVLVGSNLTINALAAGSATMAIRDSAGKTVNATITVSPAASLFTTAPSAITVAIGAASTYTVGGGVAPYTATSSNSGVATVSLSGSGMTITGIASGAALIVIRDSAGATLNVSVSVATGAVLFTTAPSAVTLAIGPANAQTYSVGGGVAPYTATSSNTMVTSASLAGSALTITGLALGTGSVVVRDSAGASITVGVTVSAGLLTVSPSSASALVGDTLFATISGGSGSYTTLVTNAAVATASVSGNTLRVDVKQQSSSVPIIITDNVSGLSTQFVLTSAPGQSQIQLSPQLLTVSELDTSPITLRVFGNNGAVTAFSSDTALLQASVSGNTVTVNTGTQGNRCVAGNTDVTISVIDSTNALATAKITISNSVKLTCP